MGPCTLVFGISGVGKTTACADYLARHPNTLFVSASTLLKRAMAASSEELRTAQREQIIGNQALLADALQHYRAGRQELPVLLDAHAVIDNDQSLVEVPVSVIADLQPSKLVLLEAKPVDIAARRLADARFRPFRDVEAIARELAAERKTVEMYGTHLDLTVFTATVGPGFRLDDTLDQ